MSSLHIERDVTIIIKTFNRPDCLHRLLESVRKYNPCVKVLVADDGTDRLDDKHIKKYVDEY